MRVSLRYLPVDEWNSESDADWGHDKAWWAHVPRLHRVLANPEGNEDFCALPPNEAPHEDFLAYWYPCIYLLVFSFGWTLPGKGLKWWFDAGRPTEDERFELISRVWDRGGHLDLLAAWLWTAGADTLAPALSLMQPTSGRKDPLRVERVDPGAEWWASFRERYPDDPNHWLMPHDPFHGGGDPMHLAYHIVAPLKGARGGFLHHSAPHHRRAVLVLDRMAGWYVRLAATSSSLPSIGDRSWYVDVFCKPVGWLGTYRRSRRTGLWFSGQHRYHEVGN